jgi:hypothetical protein
MCVESDAYDILHLLCFSKGAAVFCLCICVSFNCWSYENTSLLLNCIRKEIESRFELGECSLQHCLEIVFHSASPFTGF